VFNSTCFNVEDPYDQRQPPIPDKLHRRKVFDPILAQVGRVLPTLSFLRARMLISSHVPQVLQVLEERLACLDNLMRAPCWSEVPIIGEAKC
jgi:hypothetical protein